MNSPAIGMEVSMFGNQLNQIGNDKSNTNGSNASGVTVREVLAYE